MLNIYKFYGLQNGYFEPTYQIENRQIYSGSNYVTFLVRVLYTCCILGVQKKVLLTTHKWYADEILMGLDLHFRIGYSEAKYSKIKLE